MSRLTEKRGDAVCIEGVDFETCHMFCRTMASCHNCPIDNAFRKLAHYEDLEEQGRLIELPCPINTELYFVGEKADGTYGTHSTTLFTLDLCKSYEGLIGKGFYLTREEAVAKLEELKGAINEQTTDTTL